MSFRSTSKNISPCIRFSLFWSKFMLEILNPGPCISIEYKHYYNICYRKKNSIPLSLRSTSLSLFLFLCSLCSRYNTSPFSGFYLLEWRGKRGKWEEPEPSGADQSWERGIIRARSVESPSRLECDGE